MRRPAVNGAPTATGATPRTTGFLTRDGLRFSVLGDLRAHRGGVALDKLGPPQQQAVLLVFLHHASHAVSIAQLVDALWENDPPRSAARTIRTYVWRLRGVLRSGDTSPGELVSAGDGYRLDIEPSQVDAKYATLLLKNAIELRASGRTAEAAAALDESLTLWRGEPLVGVPGPFADRQRLHLAELHVSLVEERADLDLATGRFQTAVALLRDLAAAHPLRERLQGLLMRALYGAGRQADALAVFHATRLRLAEEIGIHPCQELIRLHQQILTGQLSRAPRIEPAATTSPTPHPVSAERSEGVGRSDRETSADSAATTAVPPADSGRSDPTGFTVAEPPASGHPTAPAFPVPAQLPPDIPDFVGRAAEVQSLCAILTDRRRCTPAVVAVTGMGGVGKTSLAVHVAHRVRSSYPDGQLYARFDGGDSDLDATRNVLAAFLSVLGVRADQMPDDVADRSRLLRSLLDGRSSLIVLDNVPDAAVIRDLIPGSVACGVIITSRSRLVGLPLTHQQCLDVLSLEAAIALLGHEIGAERVAAQHDGVVALVTACGRLPLAIRIVGARLAGRAGWPVSAMIERLDNGRQSMAELRVGDLAVEAVLESGYRRLTAAQADALRLLADVSGDELTLATAAAVLGLDEHVAEDILESLVDAAMLESSVPGRYRFHVLVRAFARQLADSRDRAEPPDTGDQPRVGAGTR
ncbi:AfsR/SARP family transcriptional regulator [Kutzneria kofuensis]|uniref:DNA-binding SARP family transcriptional activator n=1 Tax=Kutzneria kofuensis TaxID=103725 RepID=A0A7W9NL80_9PSEU|nr:AfsR/SARP family transcriptional regulator [Kutzneria kofuensis]MBB5896484.1 DNA-binding SARP family transcriptional activator [Kutzneria kofuensis]